MDGQTRKTPVEPGSEIADLAALLGFVNRITDRLQHAAAALENGITVTDWLLLRALNDEGPMPMASAARKMGVSRQRVHQQTKPLSAAGLITAGDDKALALTPKGGAAMKDAEKSFAEALSSGGGGMPTMPLHGAKLSTRRIVKSMSSKKDAAAHDDEED